MRIAKQRLATADGRRVRPAPKEAAAHYLTRSHEEWRAAVLTRAMFHCQHPACTATIRTGRLYADHIVELKDGGAALDVANGQALCHTHHARKTMRERAMRAHQG